MVSLPVRRAASAIAQRGHVAVRLQERARRQAQAHAVDLVFQRRRARQQ
jgi:hypothetical protein